jgi:RNA polymerase-binding transcription factor DksA
VEPTLSGTYELEQARKDIRKARKSGALDRKEARQLRREADRAQALADRSGRDGLSYSERRELDMQGLALQSLAQGQRARSGGKQP